MEEVKEPYVKITGTVKNSYLEKLEKIRSNYKNSKGNVFSFSGVLSLILKYGFEAFEKKHSIVIDKLPIKQKIIEEEEGV